MKLCKTAEGTLWSLSLTGEMQGKTQRAIDSSSSIFFLGTNTWKIRRWWTWNIKSQWPIHRPWPLSLQMCSAKHARERQWVVHWEIVEQTGILWTMTVSAHRRGLLVQEDTHCHLSDLTGWSTYWTTLQPSSNHLFQRRQESRGRKKSGGMMCRKWLGALQTSQYRCSGGYWIHSKWYTDTVGLHFITVISHIGPLTPVETILNWKQKAWFISYLSLESTVEPKWIY